MGVAAVTGVNVGLGCAVGTGDADGAGCDVQAANTRPIPIAHPRLNMVI